MRLIFLLLGFHLMMPARIAAASTEFAQGSDAYERGDYQTAANLFRQATSNRPAAGTFHNLGNAEWQLGQTGPAILAWERCLWIDSFQNSARGNLRFARKTAQVESPDLAWYEVVSTWLPAHWWAWITGLSFWGAVAMITLPAVLPRKKANWQQGLAALGLMIFLLSLPAYVGVHTRSNLGFILYKDVLLRLTPTEEAQVITKMSPGEPVRLMKAQGRYVLVRTPRSLGWLEQSALGLICPMPHDGVVGP